MSDWDQSGSYDPNAYQQYDASGAADGSYANYSEYGAGTYDETQYNEYNEYAGSATSYDPNQYSEYSSDASSSSYQEPVVYAQPEVPQNVFQAPQTTYDSGVVQTPQNVYSPPATPMVLSPVTSPTVSSSSSVAVPLSTGALAGTLSDQPNIPPINAVDQARWIKEGEVALCQNCTCKFSILTKRHRCRACGGIFCDGCSQDRLPVKGYTGLQRVCFGCYSKNAPLSPFHQALVDEVCRDTKEKQLLSMIVVIKKDGGGSAFTSDKRHTIMVVTEHRVMFLKRSSKKIYKHDKILDLVGIDVENEMKATLSYRRKALLQEPTPQDKYEQYIETSRIPEVLNLIRTLHAKLVRGTPSLMELPCRSPKPEYLLPISQEVLNAPILAGGFCELYQGFCNYFDVPESNELIQYIIESTQKQPHVLDLTYCPGIERGSDLSFDLRPVFYALRHNIYFLQFEVSDVAIADVIQLLADAMKTNATLTKLSLTNLETAYFSALGKSLTDHLTNAITEIDLSYTTLSDKAVRSIAGALYNKKFGLRSLKLGYCNISTKSIVVLFREGLAPNSKLSIALEELDLSGNSLNDEGSATVRSWIEKIGPRAYLNTLLLAKTHANLELVLPALPNLSYIKTLDISSNPILTETANHHLCEWAGANSSLQTLNVSNNQMDSSGIAVLLTAVSANQSLSKTNVNFAGNLVTPDSAYAFAGMISPHCNIHTLDLSDSKFDEMAAIQVIESLARCAMHLDTLVLNNFCANIASEQSSINIGNSIAQMIDTNASIQTLRMVGVSKSLMAAFTTDGSKTIVMTVVQKLKTNSSLKELDISNNRLGDPLASSLGDLLRVNRSLLRLNCDSNRITLSGWQSVAYALRANNTVQLVDYPLQDVQRCFSQFTNSLKKQKLLVDLMFEIDSLCRRNEANSGGRHPRLVQAPPSPPPSCAIDLDTLFIPEAPQSSTVYSAPSASTPSYDQSSSSSYDQSSSSVSPYGAPPPVPSRQVPDTPSYEDQGWDYNGGYDAQ
eukprot:TRINITY_DN265_c1_g1_i1.p1 TRINITY_DN265_c1_g1~~TRINITY_DN265_c1_g1_i1.p1  ORF type:complete len:1011 (+),score=465.83 TRINITY_DN265_c1_g1_i1:119-3151(+)